MPPNGANVQLCCKTTTNMARYDNFRRNPHKHKCQRLPRLFNDMGSTV